MKRRIKIIASITVAITVVGIIIYMNKGTENKHSPEFVLSYADNQSSDYPTTMGGYRFAELVEERTDGRIKIKVYPNAKLGSEGDVIKQIRFGGVDFARVSASQLVEYIDELNVIMMPYLFRDSDHMWKVLDGKIGDELMTTVNNYDVEALSWYDAGARSFYTVDKPIKSIDDMKGLKIRVQESELMANMVEALGAKAVEITYSKVYDSLKRGNIDGAENNIPSYESERHYESARYYTLDEHIRIPELQLCSKATWNKFSEEDKIIIRQCAEESAKYERELWKDKESEYRSKMEEQEVEVIELSDVEKMRFRYAMTEVYERYCSEYMDTINNIIMIE